MTFQYRAPVVRQRACFCVTTAPFSKPDLRVRQVGSPHAGWLAARLHYTEGLVLSF